ncbi:hypothetical protein IWX49DRAFT_553061 [Phyllosticta citricarpa]|uniref:Uncharacterized protein n=2 Tax=Phyllosticta TaxID=121621 RepID=A0ABR1LQZ0_9PEZI
MPSKAASSPGGQASGHLKTDETSILGVLRTFVDNDQDDWNDQDSASMSMRWNKDRPKDKTPKPEEISLVLRVSIRKLRKMDDANQDTIGDIFITALEDCKVFLDVKTTLGTQDDGYSPLQAVKRRVLVILTKASELDEQIKDSVGTVIFEGTIQEVKQFLVNATDAETAKLAITTIARHAIASMLSQARTIERKLENSAWLVLIIE